jgi:hypothetical protein
VSEPRTEAGRRKTLLEIREIAWRLHAQYGARRISHDDGDYTMQLGDERNYHDALLAAINGLLAEDGS